MLNIASLTMASLDEIARNTEGVNTIGFPGLGWVFNVKETAFKLFPFGVVLGFPMYINRLSRHKFCTIILCKNYSTVLLTYAKVTTLTFRVLANVHKGLEVGVFVMQCNRFLPCELVTCHRIRSRIL